MIEMVDQAIRQDLMKDLLQKEQAAKTVWSALSRAEQAAYNIVLPEVAWSDEFVQHDTPLKRSAIHPKLPTAKIHPSNEASMKKHAVSFKKADIKFGGHLGSILNYKEDSSDFNTPLRKGKKPNSRGDAQNIENMKHVTSHRMTAPQMSYRGDNMREKLPVGHKFTDRGFTGTSLKPSVAGNTNWSNNNNVFVIHAPKGAKGYHLDRHKDHNVEESEVTYHPDTHYQVIGHTEHKNPDYNSYNDDSPPTHRATHLAIVGQGYKGKTKDLSLTNSPEGKKWLAHVKANHAKMVERK
jgi:hypothetical protein